MNKRHLRTVLALLTVCIGICALIFTGCGKENEDSDGDGYTFTDDLGRSVTVKSPERVATLLGSFADIWCLAGGDVVATADDAWEDFGLETEAVNLGNTKSPNEELLWASDPDFVLASASTSANLNMKEKLEKAGITVAYFDVQTFDDYLRMLKICTDITGREDLYRTYGVEIKNRISSVLGDYNNNNEGREAPKVLLMRISAMSVRAKGSTGNVTGEMLKAFGCVNIADSETTLLETLSAETIIKEDPDYIFVVEVGADKEGIISNTEEFFGSNPALKELSAVKEGRLFYLENRLFNLKPNAKWGESYEKLANILSGEND